MKKAYLGIDIGSISTKGVVIDEDNNIIASSYLYTEGNPIIASKKVVKELKNKIKHGDFQFVYDELKKSDFEYTLENIEKEFSSVDNRDMFCYLLYVVSNENTPKHTILLCDYLMYSGTFFYNRETVIRYLLDNCLVKNGNDITLIEWILSMYEYNPDSPYNEKEIANFNRIYDSLK